MNAKDSESAAARTGSAAGNESDLNHQNGAGPAAGHDTQLMLAAARTEQAEARTEQARTRIEQAETRTEQAETRTEQAEARTEQAKTRTEQAETRSEEAEARSELAESRTEEAVRASELTYRRLAAIVESSDDAIIGKDLNGIITSWNNGAEKIFGFTAVEMVGTSILRLIPADRLDEETQILAKIGRGENVGQFDTKRQTKDGRLIDVSITASPIRDAAGQVFGVSKVAHDITRRKRAEAELAQLNVELEQRVTERTAQLQAANEELEAFSYSVSHDLRAPLRHVVGFVELLQKDAGPTLSEKNLRHLTTISQSAKRMGNLIDDLLAFSRVGRSEMQKTEVNLDELVRETVADLQAETKERKIAWKIHPLPPVQADRALLRMVLVNLLSNAVKFTGARAEANIEIGCAPGQQRRSRDLHPRQRRGFRSEICRQTVRRVPTPAQPGGV